MVIAIFVVLEGSWREYCLGRVPEGSPGGSPTWQGDPLLTSIIRSYKHPQADKHQPCHTKDSQKAGKQYVSS